MELEFELSGVVQRFRNEKPVFTVGRGPGNDLVILDGSVSGKHARITDGNDLATAEDVGSTNGTYVNGEQVRGRAGFAAGDRLMFGRVVVKVLTIGIGREVAPPRPPPQERTGRHVTPQPGQVDEAANGMMLPVGQEVLLVPGGGLAVPELRVGLLLRNGFPRLAEARRAPELLDRLAAVAEEVVRADLVAIYLFDPRSGMLSRSRVRVREGSTMTQPDPSNSPATLQAATQTAQSGSAIYTGRPEAPSGHRGLHVPIISGPRRIGVLSAWVPKEGLGADLRLLAVLANQAAPAYEALRSASAEVGAVLEVLAGELRQPLAALQGQVEMPPEHIGAYVDYVVGEITELAEVEVARALPAPVSFDVNAVLAEVEQYQAPAAQQRGSTFTLEPPPGPLMLVNDPKRLLQMLHHQVGGAIKVAPPGTEVVLSVRPEGRRLRLATWDAAPPEAHVGVDIALARRLAGMLGSALEVGGSAAEGTQMGVAFAL